METKIILASSSVYRRELFKRIFSDFESISPDIDENRRGNESPVKMALRLSEEKAKKLQNHQTLIPLLLVVIKPQ